MAREVRAQAGEKIKHIEHNYLYAFCLYCWLLLSICNQASVPHFGIATPWLFRAWICCMASLTSCMSRLQCISLTYCVGLSASRELQNASSYREVSKTGFRGDMLLTLKSAVWNSILTVVHTQCNGRLLLEGAFLLFPPLLPQGGWVLLADLTDLFSCVTKSQESVSGCECRKPYSYTLSFMLSNLILLSQCSV